MEPLKTGRSRLIWQYFKLRIFDDAPAEQIRLRNAIAQSNFLLVRKQAHSFVARCAVPYEDLEQIGYLGLNRAIERFDPTMGASLSSFAVPFIKGHILHHLRDHGSIVKVPRRWRELSAKAKAAEKQWFDSCGVYPSDIQLAELLSVSVVELRTARGAIANQKAVELNEEIHEQLDSIYWLPPEPIRAIASELRLLKERCDRLPSSDRDLVRGVFFERRGMGGDRLVEVIELLSAVY
jgi:RNA polymerase sigma-B factor